MVIYFILFILNMLHLRISQTFYLHSIVRNTFKSLIQYTHMYVFIYTYAYIYISETKFHETKHTFKKCDASLVFSILFLHLYEISVMTHCINFLTMTWSLRNTVLLCLQIFLFKKIKCYNAIIWVSI